MQQDDHSSRKSDNNRVHKIHKENEKDTKKDYYKDLVSRPRSNWTKEARKIEDIPQEELDRCRSDYIPKDSELMQNYEIQNAQKKLFREMIPTNAQYKPEDLQQVQNNTAITLPLPLVRRETGTYYYRGHVDGSTNVLKDRNKIKMKVKIPTNKGFNFAGLIIGPKGANQKRLEEETGCKILVRGRGSQKEGQPAAEDDWEDMHVLVAGDTNEQVAKGVKEIEKIIFADEQTRSILRHEQLKYVRRDQNKYLSRGQNWQNDDLNYNTLGIENLTAFVLPVPNECVGLLIGNHGQMIAEIQQKAEVMKIQMAADSNPNSNTRNLYIDGSEEAFLRVKKLVDEIIETHNRMRLVTSGLESQDVTLINVKLSIPANSLPTVAGKGSQNLM